MVPKYNFGLIAPINLSRDGSFGFFVLMRVCYRVLSVIQLSLFFPGVAKANIGISSLMSQSSVHFLGSQDNASAVCCLTAAPWKMSGSSSMRRTRHLISLPLSFAKLKIHIRA